GTTSIKSPAGGRGDAFEKGYHVSLVTIKGLVLVRRGEEMSLRQGAGQFTAIQRPTSRIAIRERIKK
ncbi:MAG: hypothetical protein WAN04_09830, partial [Candidatus Udaeobacter sp.]